MKKKTTKTMDFYFYHICKQGKESKHLLNQLCLEKGLDAIIRVKGIPLVENLGHLVLKRYLLPFYFFSF